MREPRGRAGGVLFVLLWCGLADAPAGPDAGGEPSRHQEFCERCHADVLPGGHPVNVQPLDTSVPPSWPLDRRGRVTCLTCHTSCGRHGPPGDPGVPGGGGARGLRSGGSNPSHCNRCHGQGSDRVPEAAAAALEATPASLAPIGTAGAQSATAAERHARVYPRAHPAAGSDGANLDRTTRQCLSCHDGAVGTLGDMGIRAPGIGERSRSHPVGVTYPPRRRLGAPRDYVPPAGLDPRIVLPGGRLGCLSCHDLFAPGEGLLVMSNRRSQLCLACHEK